MPTEPGFEETITEKEYKHVYDGFKSWAIDKKGVNPATVTPAKFKGLADEYVEKSKAVFKDLTSHASRRSYWAYYAARTGITPRREIGGTVNAMQFNPGDTFKQYLEDVTTRDVKKWEKSLEGDDSETAKRVLDESKMRKRLHVEMYDRYLALTAFFADQPIADVEQAQSDIKPVMFKKRLREYDRMLKDNLRTLNILYGSYQEAKHAVEKAKLQAEKEIKQAKSKKHVSEMVSPNVRAKHRELAPYKARRDAAIHELQRHARAGHVEADEVRRWNAKTEAMWSGIVADLELDYKVDLDKLSAFKKAVEVLEAKAKRHRPVNSWFSGRKKKENLMQDTPRSESAWKYLSDTSKEESKGVPGYVVSTGKLPKKSTGSKSRYKVQKISEDVYVVCDDVKGMCFRVNKEKAQKYMHMR